MVIVALAVIVIANGRSPSYAPYAAPGANPGQDAYCAKDSEFLQDLADAYGESYDTVCAKWHAAGGQ